jgi:hypothetical protein
VSAPEWYRVPSGEHEGRWHLAGWLGHAILTLPAGHRDSPDGVWLSISVCPRCHATVISEQSPGFAYGDQTWAHEDWHAATDYPHPA